MLEQIIELCVNNHPGVMSHVTGLFSRRAFNLEGILCGRTGDGRRSRMFLLVGEDERLGQLLKELTRLHDVHEVRLREDVSRAIFDPDQVDPARAPEVCAV